MSNLPGEQWEPSNGTEGGCFIDEWCSNCERDKVMNGTMDYDEADSTEGAYCEILNASFRGEAKEWREVNGVAQCVRFVKKGDALPDRCQNTMELPL